MKGAAVRGALALLTAALLLSACAHAPRFQPGASAPSPVPAPPADLASIPEPVPHDEPRSAAGNPPFYDVAGHRYVVLASAAGYHERGVASWYGPDFHGLRTSSGERYDMFALTAAHKTLPLPCYARVTNLANGHSVVVRINDRGPFVANRIIDLSYTAALRLDMLRNGTAFVQVEALTPASPAVMASLPVTTPAASAANVGVSNVPAVTGTAAPASPASPASTASPSPSQSPSQSQSQSQSTAASPLPLPPSSSLSATSQTRTSSIATASPTSLPSTPGTTHFYVQVGAYARADNAQRVAQRLRAAGVTHVFTLGGSPDQPLQRVRIGPIASVQEFDQLIARLGTLGFPAARLAQD